MGLPEPPTPEDAHRWAESRLRRRIMTGKWREDVVLAMREVLGTKRADAVKGVDLSSNVARSLAKQTGVLYDAMPDVLHTDAQAAHLMEKLLRDAGFASFMQRTQPNAVCIREMAMNVEITRDLQVQLRPQYPDMLVGEAPASKPDTPWLLKEATLRTLDGRDAWTWDVWDVRKPDTASRTVVDERGEDISSAALDAADRIRFDSAGRPIMPWVVYHATRAPQLWDPYDERELIEATIHSAVLWSFWMHVVRSASWPQRWAMGARPAGADTTEDGRKEVVADPAVIMLFEIVEQMAEEGIGSSARLGQFEPGADPEKLANAIITYERRAMASASQAAASDFMRMSGDPRSGYALTISREAQRESARRFEPAFRRADIQLLETVAKLYNAERRAHGAAATLPEDGWEIRYNALPPTPAERKAHREHWLELYREGVCTHLQLLMEIHGISEDKARTLQAEIRTNQATSVATP